MLQIYKVFITNFSISIGHFFNVDKQSDLNSYQESTILHISTASQLRDYLQCNSYSLKFNLIINSINYHDIFQNFKKQYSYIIAAGGVVLNEKDEVLMIFKNNIWDLPKGKKDMLESDYYAAVREINEETNVNVSSYIDGPFSSYHMYSCLREKIQKNMILKETKWFLMYANSQVDLKPQVEEHITDVVWIPKNQLFNIKTHASIKEVFKYFFK